MVHSIKFAGAALLLAVGSASAQIDLTPKDTFYEVEGIRVPNVTFRNGAKDITYSPPAGWVLSGGGQKLSLTPKDKVQAGATIQVIPSREPAPAATEENIKIYTEIATKMLPSGASKAEVVEAIICPMQLSQRPLVELTLGYVFFGQPFRMNVLFLPREKEEVRFQFSARAADYAALLRVFRASLFSIQGL